MKLSNSFWQTYKEVPSDADIPSHQLLLRAGFLNKTTGGIYSYLPFATKVLNKIKKVIREELEKIGAQEILMSFVTPAQLWKSSGRWDQMGPLMIKLKDRKDAEFCLSATNEETITDIFSATVSSYKQLPINLFQINTKFRDELRPRFGLIRGREFIMKDAYTFHMDAKCMDETYEKYFQAYSNIMKRLGLEYIAVEADGGEMAGAGAKTHEFQIIADNGEDDIVEAKEINFAANIEAAKTLRNALDWNDDIKCEQVQTEGMTSCQEVADYLNIPAHQTLKSILYTATYRKKDGSEKKAHYMFLILGDDELNEIKLRKVLKGTHALEPASAETLDELGLPKGYMGPLNKKGFSIFIDEAVELEAGYVVGANKINYHLKGLKPARDIEEFKVADIRLAKSGDLAIDGKTPVKFRKGIEVGHIFQLGDKYTKSMKAHVLDHNGKKVSPLMGCYGLGVSRILAAAVEQHHDENGIIWPTSMAPFDIYFAYIGKKETTLKVAESIYKKLNDNGFDVLFDDRNVGAGAKFKDSDLLGLPIRLVLGERDFENSKELEIRLRKSQETIKVKEENLLLKLKELKASLSDL